MREGEGGSEWETKRDLCNLIKNKIGQFKPTDYSHQKAISPFLILFLAQ